MAASKRASSMIAAVLLLAGLSGCFADAEPKSGPGSSTATMTLSPATNGTEGATNDTAPPQPPIANFTVFPVDANETNLTAGSDLLFNASSSVDPAGGELNYTWDFGDNATAEGVSVNHTFVAEGNYTVLLNVTSSTSGLSNSTSMVLLVVAGKPAEVQFTDPSGDSTQNYYDIRIVTLSDDGEHFKVKFTTAAVQPSGNNLLLTCWELFIGTARFEVDAVAGEYGVYHSGNDYVPGATAKVVATGYEITIPLEYLAEAKLGPPFDFRMESRPGVCYAGAGNSPALDKAPDTGTVRYG